MSEHQQSVTNKMEDLFLSILRNVILFVLAGSIIAAVFLAISGVSDLGAKTKDYKYEKFDSKQLINDLKESLQVKPETKPEVKPDTTKKQSPQANNPFEDEVTKQANFVVNFYKKFEFNVNTAWVNEQLKPGFRREAKNLSAVYGEGDAAILEYAKGQSQFLELVLLNTELNQLLEKKFKSQVDLEGDEKFEVIHNFYNTIRDFYPEFHAKQIKQKEEFDSEQMAEVLGRNAGAMMKIYIAGGVFVAFLFISLILVLVKIERNLRTTKFDTVTHE